MTKFKFLFLLFLSCWFWQLQSQNDTSTKTFNILFIGNSLTYTNNLPSLVKKEAKQKGINIKTKMVALPNYAIVDHWQDGNVQELIASKTYDFVVIQQGPSSQQDGRYMLINDGKKLNILCENSGAKLVYFMVWPPINHPERFAGVIKNHTDAATINDALLCPVGQVWKAYFEATGNYDYYGSDGFHPSKKGSNKAAEVIVEILFSN